MSALLVLTNVADRDIAARLANELVERRLAACVNILAGCTSVYRWKGSIESATEVPLLIKTDSSLYDRVEAAIQGLHTYELPEIIAVPVERGLSEYLQWISAQTGEASKQTP